MDELIKLMKERAETLRKGIAKAEKDVGTFPDGWLRINPSANRLRYYHLTDPGDREGEYIKKENHRLAYRLAQKDYNTKFLREAKQELVTPYISTDNLFAKEWQSRSFKSNPYRPENKIYDTRRGEKVRSKSEAILADMFYELGIPYHYEKPIKLRNGNTRYPDFTLLKVKTREEIYLEHFGLLDDEEYRRECFYKLDEYRNSGIYTGRNLLFTYETATNPLDIKGIKRMLEELLCL